MQPSPAVLQNHKYSVSLLMQLKDYATELASIRFKYLASLFLQGEEGSLQVFELTFLIVRS